MNYDTWKTRTDRDDAPEADHWPEQDELEQVYEDLRIARRRIAQLEQEVAQLKARA